jgi:hypothetical protein
MEYYNDMEENQRPNEYVIEIESIDDWQVFGFIDDRWCWLSTMTICRSNSEIIL